MKRLVPPRRGRQQRRTQKDAVELLHEWVDLTPEAAVVTLNNMMQAAHMLGLYKHFFPKEFRASKANDRKSTNHRFSSYTDKEQEFFRLLERCLPINDFYLETEEERFDYVPINVASIDYEDLENYRLAIAVPFLLYQGLDGVQDPESFWDRVAASLPPDADLPRPDGDVDWRKFKRLLRKAVPERLWKPMEWLRRYVCYSTDNAYLDTTAEMLSYSNLPTWTVKELRWLMQEWERAEKINKQIEQAEDWLEADHYRGLAEYIRIWNQACRPKLEAPEPTRKEAM